MNSGTEYFILPGDDVADTAKKEIIRMVEETEDPHLHVSPRGRIIALAGVPHGAKVFSEVVSLPTEEEVAKYYVMGGAHGFVPASTWLKAYNALADLKGLMQIV